MKISVALRRLDDPRLLGELVLELAGPPAGVAGEHARAAHGVEQLLGVGRLARHEAEVVLDQHGRLVGVVPLGEHDHAVGRDRAADVDALLGLGQPVEVGHRVADRRRRRPVEHEAHRALLGVLDDQHDGAAEVGSSSVGPAKSSLPRSESMGQDCAAQPKGASACRSASGSEPACPGSPGRPCSRSSCPRAARSRTSTRRIGERYPELAPALPSALPVVAGVHVEREAALHPGDEVALLIPVAGGAGPTRGA